MKRSCKEIQNILDYIPNSYDGALEVLHWIPGSFIQILNSFSGFKFSFFFNRFGIQLAGHQFLLYRF